MARRHCYDYPRPSVTVDLAVFARKGAGLRVLMIRRKHDPFAGAWALPGGFLEMDETIEAGARRELQEETGLVVPGPVPFIGVYSAPGRDPRGRTISMAHATTIAGPPPAPKGSDDAAEAKWIDPWTAKDLAFDHDEILTNALRWLADDVMAGPSGLTLLPMAFDVAEVGRLFGAVRVSTAKASTWVEGMERLGLVVRDGERYVKASHR